MSTSDLVSTWRELLLRTFPRDLQERSAHIDLSPLRAFVSDFVRTAKSRGDPSERVIRALKQLTTAAIFELAPPKAKQQLLDDIFGWCLDDYYGAREDPVLQRGAMRVHSSIELR